MSDSLLSKASLNARIELASRTKTQQWILSCSPGTLIKPGISAEMFPEGSNYEEKNALKLFKSHKAWIVKTLKSARNVPGMFHRDLVDGGNK